MHVTADQSRCCGAGLCVLNVPEVFDQRDEDGIVVVLDDTPPEELAAAVHEAAGMCPSGAISVHVAPDVREVPEGDAAGVHGGVARG
jgi:ferredoxin